MGKRGCFTGDQALEPVAHARKKQPGTERYNRDLNLLQTLLLTLSSIVSSSVELTPSLLDHSAVWGKRLFGNAVCRPGQTLKSLHEYGTHASHELRRFYWYMSLTECNSLSKGERLCHAGESLFDRWISGKSH